MAGWAQVDVLQCVGVTLACIQLLVLVTGKPKCLAITCAILAVCSALLAPFSGGIACTKHIPLALGVESVVKMFRLNLLFSGVGKVTGEELAKLETHLHRPAG
jgi:hypothetical protein